MKVVSSYNNFARAKIDHNMNGRYDLPIYPTGADAFENYISNFQGNAIYRTGFEDMLAFQDCAFIEFKFQNNQNYILVLYNLKMRFLSYDVNGLFGWVLDGASNPLEITTPWTLAESKAISKRQAFTQNFDVMIITHDQHEPQRLQRTAANVFTLRPYGRKDDPFSLTFAATKTITNITQAVTPTVTVAGHGYSSGDRVRISAVVGMTQLNGWSAAIISVTDANNFVIDVDTTNYTAYGSGGTTEKVLTGDYPYVSLFYKGRLDYARSRLKTTTVWQSEAAQYYIHTLPATVTDASALQYTIAEIAQPIEWLFPGSNSLIAGAADGIVAINGGSPGDPITSATVEANITPADGASYAQPLLKDGFLFYIGKNSRNAFYFNYDVLSETFLSQDANVISYDISEGLYTKFRYTKDRNNLIHYLRADGDLCTMNFNAGEKIVGWNEHFTEGQFDDIAQISDNDGNPQIFALTLRNGVYYIERQAAYVEFANRKNFYTAPADESKVAKAASRALDDMAYYRYVAEQLKQCIHLDNSTTFSDLRSTTLTFNGAATVTASGPSFLLGDVGKQIVYKTATGYESGRFEITGYTNATTVTVTVLQTPTANVYSSWYMTFNQLTGLARFNGIPVGIVTDGGYLADYTAAAGVINLPNQVTHAVAGYRYRGVIKSFSLGFQIQANNTQTTMKAVATVGIRTVNSVGLKFGTNPYDLERVQELGQNDLNYLPPLPLDGTKQISYADNNERDKYFYIVQDEPGPATVTGVIINCNYTLSE